MNVMIVCTGNSCRSQMAEGLLRDAQPDFFVYSAGVEPAEHISTCAVKVMQEIGIDISQNEPKNISSFLEQDWDYVITVCDHANELCPVFSGRVKHRLHVGFDDPYLARGTEEFILGEYRRVRDEIRERLVLGIRFIGF